MIRFHHLDRLKRVLGYPAAIRSMSVREPHVVPVEVKEAVVLSVYALTSYQRTIRAASRRSQPWDCLAGKKPGHPFLSDESRGRPCCAWVCHGCAGFGEHLLRASPVGRCQ